MPQRLNFAEAAQLKTTPLSAIIQDGWDHHHLWYSTQPQAPFSSLAAQTRLFYPRSYTASASLNALNSPWFIDYGHLTFWFFFLSTFVLAMWLVTLHGLASKNVEARSPRRETRGFSRAQAGDIMTAVLPMTWSITMLLHASTHSINFDENTAATVFSFHVIAYQWGWNYYFPRDIVDKLTRGPRMVGRGHVDLNQAPSNYSLLLERARNEYLARLTARGAFADRFGKDAVANTLTLFTRPGGASQGTVDSAFLRALWATSIDFEAPQRALWRAQLTWRLLRTLVGAQSFELSADQSASPHVWTSAALGSRRLASVASTKLGRAPVFTSLRLRATRAPYPHTLKTMKVSWRKVSQLPAVPHWLAVLNSQRLSREQAFTTMRAGLSTSLVGNRLSLIHKHLASARPLGAPHSRRPLLAAYIRRLTLITRGLGPVASTLPAWASTEASTARPVGRANLGLNLWLARVPSAARARLWALELGRLPAYTTQTAARGEHPLRKDAPLLASFNAIPGPVARLLAPAAASRSRRLAYLAAPQPLLCARAGRAFNAAKASQARLFSGTPYSLGFATNNALTLDDSGLANAAAVKELTLRLNASAIRASVTLLASSATRRSKPLSGFALLNRNDQAGRALSAHASRAPFSLAPRALTFTSKPQTPLAFNWTLASTATAQGEISSARRTWSLAALPLPSSLAGFASAANAVYGFPAQRLRLTALLAPSLASALYPQRLSGASSAAPLWPSTTKGAQARRATASRLVTSLPSPLSLPACLRGSAHASLPNLPTPALAHFLTTGLKAPFQEALTLADLAPLLTRAMRPLGVRGLEARKGRKQALTLTPLFGPFAQTRATARLYPSLVRGAQTRRVKTYYSSLLEGPTLQRPVRSTLDKTGDPVNFIGKGDPLSRQVFYHHLGLFSWFWNWSAGVTPFSFPFAKIATGAVGQRPASGFWNMPWAGDRLSHSALNPERALVLDKQSWPLLTTALRQAKRKVAYPQVAAAVLDNEWAALLTIPAALTPEPYEDLDQPFIHQKWGVEINTTRRSDHNSKYKVLWGPFAMSKKLGAALNSDASQAYLGAVGPAAANLVPTRVAQTIALFNTTTLPFKATPGLLPLKTHSRMGDFFISPKLGPMLSEGLLPLSSQTANAHSLGRGLKSLLQKGPAFGASAKPASLQSPWLQLWRFKSALADVRLLDAPVHHSAYPAFWHTRALLVTSLREELLANAVAVGANRANLNDEEAVGAQAALLQDITAVFALAPEQAKAHGLRATSWHQIQANLLDEGVASLLKTALDLTVEAHLLARAGHSLVQDEVGAIRRLRVTKGIYLPSDIPMHVISGSKDVIHSWAIPGLNIKIDSIPGFNSHRRLLLRWRGAYWGQCMEVCGRYHHWMPILVHVVHKDIFLGWCLSYLRLVDARAIANSKALHLLATTDLVSLDMLLARALARHSLARPRGALNAALLVSADLDD